MNAEYTFEGLNEWSSGDLTRLVLEMQEELKNMQEEHERTMIINITI